jgi:tetratricopeptide (TPR) repeat protein
VSKLSASQDPPLASKAPAYLYYIIKPVINFVFQQGETALTERTARHFMDSFSDKNGVLMTPRDVALNAQAFLVENLTAQKRYEDSILAIKKLIALDSSNSFSYYLLSENQEMADRPDDSLKTLETALKLDPYELRYIIKYANLLAKFKSIRQGFDFLGQKAEFLAANGMPNSASVLRYNQNCLLVSPDTGDDNSVSPSQRLVPLTGGLGN